MIKKCVILVLFSLFSFSLYSMEQTQLTDELIKNSLPAIIEALKSDGYVIEKESFFSQHKYKLLTLGTAAAAAGTYYLIKRLTNFATKKDVDKMVLDVSGCYQAHITTMHTIVNAVDNEVNALSLEINQAHHQATMVSMLSQVLRKSTKQLHKNTQYQFQNLDIKFTDYADTLKKVQEQFNQGSSITELLLEESRHREHAVDVAMMQLVPTVQNSQQNIHQNFNLQGALMTSILLKQQQTQETVDNLANQTGLLAEKSKEHTLGLEELLKLSQSMQSEFDKVQDIMNETKSLHDSFTQG